MDKKYNHVKQTRQRLNGRNLHSSNNIDFLIHFYVFHEEKYVGWDCFSEKKVTAGKSSAADLVLADDSLSDIHAAFFIDGNRMFVSSDRGHIRINDKPVRHSIVGPLDTVGIGKFNLKIKLKKLSGEIQEEMHSTRDVLTVGTIPKTIQFSVDHVLKDLLNEKADVLKYGQPNHSIRTEKKQRENLTIDKVSFEVNGRRREQYGDFLSKGEPDPTSGALVDVNTIERDPLGFFDDVDIDVSESLSDVISDIEEKNRVDAIDRQEHQNHNHGVLREYEKGKSGGSDSEDSSETGELSNVNQAHHPLVSGRKSAVHKKKNEKSLSDDGLIYVDTVCPFEGIQSGDPVLHEIETILDELLPEDHDGLPSSDNSKTTTIGGGDLPVQKKSIESESNGTLFRLDNDDVENKLDELFPECETPKPEEQPDDFFLTAILTEEDLDEIKESLLADLENEEKERVASQVAPVADEAEPVVESGKPHRNYHTEIHEQVSEIDLLMDELLENTPPDSIDKEINRLHVAPKNQEPESSDTPDNFDAVLEILQQKNNGNSDQGGVEGDLQKKAAKLEASDLSVFMKKMDFYSEAGFSFKKIDFSHKTNGTITSTDLEPDYFDPYDDEDVELSLYEEDDDEIELSLFDGRANGTSDSEAGEIILRDEASNEVITKSSVSQDDKSSPIPASDSFDWDDDEDIELSLSEDGENSEQEKDHEKADINPQIRNASESFEPEWDDGQNEPEFSLDDDDDIELSLYEGDEAESREEDQREDGGSKGCVDTGIDFDDFFSMISNSRKTSVESPVVQTESVQEKAAIPMADEDDDDDDIPAPYSLREILTNKDKKYSKRTYGFKVIEIIKFSGSHVLDASYVAPGDSAELINEDNEWCSISYTKKQSIVLSFNKALLDKIGRSLKEDALQKKSRSSKGLLYEITLDDEKETLFTDGAFEYLIRRKFIQNISGRTGEDTSRGPVVKRVLKSKGFSYVTKAALFHLLALVLLSFTIKAPLQEVLDKKDPKFVVVETKNIYKPVKPKKPKPVVAKPKPKVAETKPEKKPEKKQPVKPQEQKIAVMKPPQKVQPPVEPPEAGGGHKGNVVNRDINSTGLLGSLGIKDDIGIKPNKALAAVTNIDAVTSTHSREARVKVGGIVGSLGDKGIALNGGEAFLAKGTHAMRSAGISGKGNVAALESGRTGKRSVAGAVSAPLTKSVKFKGGGISREAVAKVINEHIDEINFCYESALINDPSLMGKVVFEWKILTTGRVGEVKIKSSSIKSDDIHSCIKDAIRSWVFPKPQGAAVVVSYPFVFDVSGF